MNKKNSKSLINDKYKKNNITATELLTPNEINDRLKNFYRVKPNDIKSLTVNTRIQYFQVSPDGKYKYRTGGTLIVNKAPVYLILSNGKKNWSVQLDTHIIFAGQDIETVRKEYEQKIAEKNKKIAHLTLYIKKLKQSINKQEKTK
jgi:hypothetical protein